MNVNQGLPSSRRLGERSISTKLARSIAMKKQATKKMMVPINLLGLSAERARIVTLARSASERSGKCTPVDPVDFDEKAVRRFDLKLLAERLVGGAADDANAFRLERLLELGKRLLRLEL